MKILFIGGTGNISAACTRLALNKGYEVYHLNRGKSGLQAPAGVKQLQGDIYDEKSALSAIGDHSFDVVVNFVAFTAEDAERDIRLFRGKLGQYIFISSASCYQKPVSHPVITESTPLSNPFWQYSRDKIAAEEILNTAFRETGFPATIVRPSLTYDTVIPVAIGGWTEFNIIARIRKGKKIIVHGDGTSLWTITHSDDFAVGFTGLLGHQQANGHAFHITSDEILTWNQIYQATGEAAGEEPKIIHIPSDFIASVDDFQTGNLLGDKAHSVIFDNSKIRRFVPEFIAPITYRSGIKRTIKWLESKPERMVLNPETDKMMDRIINLYETGKS
jgi:nucleoside-diphosphate-sugar epimerase